MEELLNLPNQFTGLPASSGVITVMNALGCEIDITYTVHGPTNFTASIAAQSNLLCFGDTNGV
ncbi:MAG: hypothetical protein R2798_06870 [Chitinophagales bacterium]